MPNILARKHQLARFLEKGQIGREVLELLLPDGEPLEKEGTLWDYKLSLPSANTSSRPKAGESEARRYAYGQIIKDVVSFYNSRGGYLVIGVRDRPRETVGFDDPFDCDELNRMTRAACKHRVDCHYSTITTNIGATLGLLLIPRRPHDREPAQFLRDGPKNSEGQLAFKRATIYMRDMDESRPAKSAEDYMFLCGSARRLLPDDQYQTPRILDHNLPPRDPEFVKFVGREEDLNKLWRWLCDEFSPVRLLAGLGGVGKTTLAREFIEDVRRCSPLNYEKIIWLSAKKKTFAATRGTLTPTPRVDFRNVDEMLRSLLIELALPKEELDQGWSRIELEEELISALKVLPSLIVIDDLDSLPSDQQSEAFHTCIALMNRLTGAADLPSRALLTARLELGAAPGQLMRVSGLPYDAFYDYVQMMSEKLGVEWGYSKKSRIAKRFHRTTEGSPLFANSILRLLRLGERLHDALKAWEDNVGADVRKFAFERELQGLPDSKLRTLYALCCLGECSRAELQEVTESAEGLLADDLGVLRDYHLVETASEAPVGGPRLAVPDNIRLMSDVIANRLLDPRKIERNCKKLRSGTGVKEHEIGRAINEATALWKQGENKEALKLAQWAAKKHTHPDLHCLLGRAYLNVSQPRKADASLRKAFRLGCRRHELPDLWIAAKRNTGDWMGITQVVESLPSELVEGDELFEQANALVELGKIAISNHKREVGAEKFKEAGFLVDRAFSENLARGRVEDLKELRRIAFQQYVHLLAEIRPSKNEHIDVWLAAWDAFRCFVRSSSILSIGVRKLGSWWGSVEARESFDFKASDLFEIQLGRLDRMIAEVTSEPSHRPVLDLLQTERDKLRLRWREYVEVSQDS